MENIRRITLGAAGNKWAGPSLRRGRPLADPLVAVTAKDDKISSYFGEPYTYQHVIEHKEYLDSVQWGKYKDYKDKKLYSMIEGQPNEMIMAVSEVYFDENSPYQKMEYWSKNSKSAIAHFILYLTIEKYIEKINELDSGDELVRKNLLGPYVEKLKEFCNDKNILGNKDLPLVEIHKKMTSHYYLKAKELNPKIESELKAFESEFND